MARGDSIASYFMKIYDLRDQLGTMGEIIEDRELVMITLNGLPAHWDPFIQSVSGISKLPMFDILWADCTQEEMRLATRGGTHPKENQALASHARKGKGRDKGRFEKRDKRGGSSSPPRKNKRKHFSKIQCFKCDKFGHCASRCPLRLGKKRYASLSDT